MVRSVLMCMAAAGVLAGCAYDDGYYADRRYPDRYASGPGYHSSRYDGCSDTTAFGTVAGAVAGGVIGNQFGSGSGKTAATVGGAILGGIAGNAIARDACRDERYDAYYYNPTYYDAFDQPVYGRRYEWRNARNGNYGYITPVRVVVGDRYGYRSECREFRQTVWVNGRQYDDTGVACRTDDGTWRIVSD